MKALTVVCVVFFGFMQVTLSAGDAKDDAIKKERKRFEGTWQVESVEVDAPNCRTTMPRRSR